MVGGYILEVAMKSLILHPTPLAQWHAIINDAQLWRHLELGETLESYLVFLLMRYTDRPALNDSILGQELLQGLQAPDVGRQWQLRDVGDKCLLFAGLFPDYTQHLHVEGAYFNTVGRQAYRAIFHHYGNELYLDLAEHFTHMQDILLATRLLATEPIHELSIPNSLQILINSFKSNH
jgi:hypothetical protein